MLQWQRACDKFDEDRIEEVTKEDENSRKKKTKKIKIKGTKGVSNFKDVETPEMFNNIGPDSIRQGALGNCYLGSTLAVLAENPNRIKNLFLTNEYNEFGVYGIKITKNGRSVSVVVDDSIPCF